MRKMFLGAVLMLIGVVFYQYYQKQLREKETTLESSQLIQEQIQNVGKLVVTEGHFSDVITYRDAKKYYLDVFTAKKKALVIVNAEATVSYDLARITYEIDQEKKRVMIKSIPEPELKIHPEFKYYDVQQDYLNPFGAADYNKIKTAVQKRLERKVRKSTLFTNAKNRLISELQKLWIVTNSLEWQLQYDETIISEPNDFELVP